MAPNFTSLMKNMNLQSPINSKKDKSQETDTWTYNLSKDKEKILKALREKKKKSMTYKEFSVRLMANFSSEVIKAKRQ